jgi:nitrite reductase/ring-hydroxylating ferredoxin subunit
MLDAVGVELGSSFLAEVEARYAGRWTCVGFADRLPSPESRFVYEAPGRSILVCRDRAGALGAFVNACTHRGTRLCTGPGRGRIQCPYHGWVFGCDGQLLGATRRAGLPAFDDADYALRPLAARAVGPLVFAHDDPAAAALDLEPALRALLEGLGPASVERRRTLRRPWLEVLEGPPAFPAGPLARWLSPGGEEERWLLPPNLRIDRQGPAVALRVLSPLGPTATRVEGRLYGAGRLYAAMTRFG